VGTYQRTTIPINYYISCRFVMYASTQIPDITLCYKFINFLLQISLLFIAKIYCRVFQWLRRGFGLVDRIIVFLLVVIIISSYILKITVTTAPVTSHTKSSNSSSGHTAVPLELRNSSEVNSHSRILSYPLGTDHHRKHILLLRSADHIGNKSPDNCLASPLAHWL
jgi:hypothetical protein